MQMRLIRRSVTESHAQTSLFYSPFMQRWAKIAVERQSCAEVSNLFDGTVCTISRSRREAHMHVHILRSCARWSRTQLKLQPSSPWSSLKLPPPGGCTPSTCIANPSTSIRELSRLSREIDGSTENSGIAQITSVTWDSKCSSSWWLISLFIAKWFIYREIGKKRFTSWSGCTICACRNTGQV